MLPYRLSARQCKRPLLVHSTKQHPFQGDLIRPVSAGSTAVLCLTSLINAPPSVKLACTATALATAAAHVALHSTAQQQQQQQQSHRAATGDSLVGTSGGSVALADSSSSSGSSAAGSVEVVTPASEQLLAVLQTQPAVRWAAAGAAGAAVVSVLLPPEDLPAVSSVCFLAFVWGTLQEQQQQQQQQQAVRGPSTDQLPQQPAADDPEKQELQRQLQRLGDKVRTLTASVQQLERELKQARKGGGKLDSVRQQLKQEQREKQELGFKLLLAERQLQSAQDQLAALQQVQRPASSTSSPPLSNQQQQQQQQQQPVAAAEQPGPPTDAGAADAKRVVAFVGGRSMKPSDRKLLPRVVGEVRFFGSSRDTGVGDLKRLEAAIKAGSIDEVYMTTRWNGHNTTQIVRQLCRDRGIPCHLLDAAGKARRKGEWDAASGSGSDTESGWESS